MLTREMIEKDEATVKFAEHFKTKNSIKNLLKKIPNAKAISPLFEDGKYGKEILGYSNLEEQFDVIMGDVFTLYTVQVAEWRENGNTRSLPERVDFLKDLISERMKKHPGEDIAATLGDFMKSTTGKEIEGILKEAGIEDSNSLYFDIITWIAARTLINESTTPIEVLEGEVIVENAGHSKTKKPDKKNNEVATTREIELETCKKAIDLVSGLASDVSDDEILRTVSIIKPYVPDMINEIAKMIDKLDVSDDEHNKNSRIEELIRKELPKNLIIKNIDVNKLVKFISSIDFGDGSDIMVRNLFFIILDTLKNSDDDNKLFNTAKFIIKMLKCDENESAFVEELLVQSGRVNDIIKDLYNVKEDVSKPKDEDTEEYQMTDDEREFVEEYERTHKGDYKFGETIGKIAASYIRRTVVAQ